MDHSHLTRNTLPDLVMILVTRHFLNLSTIPDDLAIITRERGETGDELAHDFKKQEGIPQHDAKFGDTSHETSNVSVLHDEQVEIFHMETEVNGVLLQLEDDKKILVRFEDLDRE